MPRSASRSASGSRTSARRNSPTHGGFSPPCACGINASNTTGSWPSAASRSATCEPMKPAPPVTRTRTAAAYPGRSAGFGALGVVGAERAGADGEGQVGSRRGVHPADPVDRRAQSTVTLIRARSASVASVRGRPPLPSAAPSSWATKSRQAVGGVLILAGLLLLTGDGPSDPPLRRPTTSRPRTRSPRRDEATMATRSPLFCDTALARRIERAETRLIADACRAPRPGRASTAS